MPYRFIKLTVLIVFIFFNTHLNAQLINHYWIQNFNSVSSLIGGAVVAGDGDNSSIYYNPATIVEMQHGSNVSIAANLFSWNIYNNYNALGEGNHLHNTNFQVQPQFFSFTYKPKKGNLSYAFSILTRTSEDYLSGYANSEIYDILPRLQGQEIYNTLFKYHNKYYDTWIGLGFGHQLNNGFSYGATLFVSASGLIYNFAYSASAYNFTDSTNNNLYPSFVSESAYSEHVKFTQYRIITKFGLAYKINNWRFGLVVTTPSLNVYTSGRVATRMMTQINIHNSNGMHIPDFEIFSAQEKDQLKANYKYPFAISFGFIGTFKEGRQKLYFSMEYFNRIKPYNMISAEIDPNITSPSVYDSLPNKDYLTYAYKADPVFNVAIGYSWIIRKNLKFVNAIRTDFTSINNINSEELNGYNYIKTDNFNIYHYSAGLNFLFKKNKVTAGFEFSYGYKNDEQQIVNFNDAVEFNPETGDALLGPIDNNVCMRYYGINLYISATLNFLKNDN